MDEQTHQDRGDRCDREQQDEHPAHRSPVAPHRRETDGQDAHEEGQYADARQRVLEEGGHRPALLDLRDHVVVQARPGAHVVTPDTTAEGGQHQRADPAQRDDQPGLGVEPPDPYGERQDPPEDGVPTCAALLGAEGGALGVTGVGCHRVVLRGGWCIEYSLLINHATKRGAYTTYSRVAYSSSPSGDCPCARASWLSRRSRSTCFMRSQAWMIFGLATR